MSLNSPKQKEKFIRDLCRTVQNSLLADIPKMPEAWDGHELRQLIADRFNGQVSFHRHNQRYREYRNELIVRNL